MMKKTDLHIIHCDFSNELHCKKVAELVGHYMADPMGGVAAHGSLKQLRLVDGLANHPSCLVLLACVEQDIVGMATCFINFSTFGAAPYLNIHDIIVLKDYRRQGIGKELVTVCVDIARARKYCKVTLEVRNDNTAAQSLYRQVGFGEGSPGMSYWTLTL